MSRFILRRSEHAQARGARGPRTTALVTAAAVLGGLVPSVLNNTEVVHATNNYASTVLADGPVAYWRFGDTSGTTATDASGNGHSAT